MGKMNLLKANYSGRVGQTVGAKWKKYSTLRTYTVPSNPNTEEQQKVRRGFSDITSFVALFADQIKYKTALDTSGMSLRNAIIKANKASIKDENFNLKNLIISKGGLQKPAGTAFTVTAGIAKWTWTAPTATNFSANAKAIAVFVDADDQIVEVVEADVTGLSAEGTTDFGANSDVYGFLYFLDKRGSNKVASLNVGAMVAHA